MATEADILVALQRGLPICARPFDALADDLDCSPDDLIATIARCRAQGTCRRFGAVFDTRRLGYTSALCAVAAPASELDALAAQLTPLTAVTHCYLREPLFLPVDAFVSNASPSEPIPNLWFTLSAPAESFDAISRDVAARLAPHALHILPATRRYKVDVVFGAATRAHDEQVTDRDLPPPTARERAIIGALQGDTEVRADYFAAIAEQLGEKEWDLLSTLELWRRKGRLKRIGLLLAHRAAGWTANGMCCWRVQGDTAEAGRALASRVEVTHCYERPEAPGFPFNLFAMIHAHTLDEAKAQFAAIDAHLAAVAGATLPSTMLLSTHEYKKTSMTFFPPRRV